MTLFVVVLVVTILVLLVDLTLKGLRSSLVFESLAKIFVVAKLILDHCADDARSLRTHFGTKLDATKTILQR